MKHLLRINYFLLFASFTAFVVSSAYLIDENNATYHRCKARCNPYKPVIYKKYYCDCKLTEVQ